MVFLVKTNKVLVVFVIIFFLTTVAGVSYIVYEEFFNNNSSVDNIKNNGITSSNKEKMNGEEELEVNSRLVQSLYNKVVLNGDSNYKYFMYGDNDNYFVEEADVASKLTLAYFNLKSKDIGDIDIEGIDNTKIIPSFSYSSFSEKAHTLNVVNNKVKFIPYNSLLIAYQDLFGKDASFDKNIPISINSYGGIYYVYDQNLDGYVPYVITSGVTSASYFTGKIKEALKNDKQIKIYEEVKEIYYDGSILNSATYVYTFNIDEDGLYTFVSRIKE